MPLTFASTNQLTALARLCQWSPVPPHNQCDGDDSAMYLDKAAKVEILQRTASSVCSKVPNWKSSHPSNFCHHRSDNKHWASQKMSQFTSGCYHNRPRKTRSESWAAFAKISAGERGVDSPVLQKYIRIKRSLRDATRLVTQAHTFSLSRRATPFKHAKQISKANVECTKRKVKGGCADWRKITKSWCTIVDLQWFFACSSIK